MWVRVPSRITELLCCYRPINVPQWKHCDRNCCSCQSLSSPFVPDVDSRAVMPMGQRHLNLSVHAHFLWVFLKDPLRSLQPIPGRRTAGTKVCLGTRTVSRVVLIVHLFFRVASGSSRGEWHFRVSVTELGTPLPCHAETLLSSRLCGPLAISFGERLTAMELRTDLHAVRIFASQCHIVNPITFTTNNTLGESKSHFRFLIFQEHFQVSFATSNMDTRM